MTLSRGAFADFFAELHDGHPPFDWQERLLSAVLDSGSWPSRIVAPTGAGKTAVVDVHVFAQALTAGAAPLDRPPRRLALVVGRRVLVDDQYDYARSLAERLAEPQSEVMEQVAARLTLLRAPGRSEALVAEGMVSPLVTARLRGGQPPSRAWRDYPTAAAVICATPDMWGSRLLFRGYGSSSKGWPREAGLLAFDSVVVVDEAHLSRQLLCTARRVSQLAAVATDGPPTRPLHVVETTATPPAPSTETTDVDRASIGVEPPDLDAHGTLGARLQRPKPIRLLEVSGWSGKGEPQRRRTVTAITDAVIGLLGEVEAVEGAASTVGCFVNTVARAVDVASELRRRAPARRPLQVVLLCGQVRPHDLDRLRAEHPGVLATRGNDAVDVIVATQTLEVGVDIDLAGMVTELASGSAIAQRAGRINRRGLRRSSPVVVVAPEEDIPEKVQSGPYAADELSAALTWVRTCSGDAAGLAPWRLRELPPPATSPRRRLYQRPELGDAWHWARTSDDLAAEPEMDLWLTEDFQADTSVGVVVREALPDDPADAIRLVQALPPRRHETFPVPFRAARVALQQWDLIPAGRDAYEAAESARPAIVVRGEDVVPLEWRVTEEDDLRTPAIRPGDVVVVDSREKLFTSSRAGQRGGFSPPVLALGEQGVRLERQRADDVLSAQPDAFSEEEWARRDVGGVVLRLEPNVLGVDEADFDRLAAALSAAAESVAETSAGGGPDEVAVRQRQALSAWLDDCGLTLTSRMARSAQRLLVDSPQRSELIVHTALDAVAEPEGDDAPRITRVLLIDRRRVVVDEGLRQVWVPAGQPVTLEQHQAAVAERAVLLAQRLGLSPGTQHALRLAGAHHDDGKADERFQRRLGRRGDVVLAKSRPGISPEQTRRNEARSGLPSRWRHEQRSVLDCWAAVHEVADDAVAKLALRLVGTTHGHGRSAFPHTADELLPYDADDDLRARAIEVFQDGVWDELVEITHHRHGVWGCAFLEAVLRAADGQVSEEGS